VEKERMYSLAAEACKFATIAFVLGVAILFLDLLQWGWTGSGGARAPQMHLKLMAFLFSVAAAFGLAGLKCLRVLEDWDEELNTLMHLRRPHACFYCGKVVQYLHVWRNSGMTRGDFDRLWFHRAVEFLCCECFDRRARGLTL